MAIYWGADPICGGYTGVMAQLVLFGLKRPQIGGCKAIRRLRSNRRVRLLRALVFTSSIDELRLLKIIVWSN